MRVLLTGATGFVGSHATRALQDDGHVVRVLVRDPAKLTSVTSRVGVDVAALDVIIGDITDEASVMAAVDGCDAAVHTAAVVATDPSRDVEVEATNLVGAENVLEAATTRGCDPVIHVSSASALFPFRSDPVTADHPVGTSTSAYGRTKAGCERLARKLQADGHAVVTIYPAMIIGPDDWNESGQTEPMKLWLTKPYPRSKGFTISCVDVRDIAAVMAASMQKGRGARRYIMFGHHLTCEEHIAILGLSRGRELRTVPVPRAVFWAWGRLGDLARRLGRDLVLTSEGYDIIFNSVRGDSEFTESDTGVKLRPIVESFRDTIRWMHQSGAIAADAAGVLAGG